MELALNTGVNNVALSRWKHGYQRLGSEALDAIEDFLTDELLKLKSFEPWRHHRSAFANDDARPQPRKKGNRQHGRTRQSCAATTPASTTK